MDVRKLYYDLLSQGKTKKDAAKEAQARTGMSVVTGRAIVKRFSETKDSFHYGQYRILK